MNLYGDYANISALCRILEKNGVDFTLDKRTLGDELSLSDYDFIYVGSGSEENQKLALSHLAEYKTDLASYIESGRFALFTGNSFEMLGKSINSFLGSFEGLGIFDFAVTEQNKTRDTADAILEADFLSRPLVGFINKCSLAQGIEVPLFTVKMGLPDSENGSSEGVFKNNFFGTHLTGPVLVKNPHFLQYLAEKLTGKEMDISAFKNESAGYEITLKKLGERNGK